MSLVQRRVRGSAGSLITVSDIQGATPMAVSKALSRLAQQGKIQRVRKGVYYVPKETLLGPSQPSEPALIQKVLAQKARPTGTTAANILGLSTQLEGRPEFAAYVTAPPSGMGSARLRLRPRSRTEALEPKEAALLEFLRDRGRHGELNAAQTYEHLCMLLREMRTPSGSSSRSARLRRLRDAALSEPPRVRAMLGALMQVADLSPSLWEPLRASLNPLSRFDFGLFRELPNAREWQAK